MQSCSRSSSPDVLLWPQNHSVTWFNPGLGFFENGYSFNLQKSWRIANKVGLVRRQVRADTVTESVTGNAHPQESATASTKRNPYWCIA
ncbi:hypothetical protein OUZ56_003865 [Daphnia magna]|uniref:Uncharacterized protein n=1 Tax=Daphnia magna TaxID=35525 RepID=A0ABQ9YN49_9CRUS|nr:hypothetical protein OUZ56_003865 [Daphnia magna]